MVDKLARILYVEDEPDIQTVAKLALEAVGGFTVEVCSSADEAMQRSIGFQPQLFLLDVMMPGTDGPSALKMLRSLPQFADTPAIFMTAKVRSGEIADYRALGALGVIPKPFDPMLLADRVLEIWEHHYD